MKVSFEGLGRIIANPSLFLPLSGEPLVFFNFFIIDSTASMAGLAFMSRPAPQPQMVSSTVWCLSGQKFLGLMNENFKIFFSCAFLMREVSMKLLNMSGNMLTIWICIF